MRQGAGSRSTTLVVGTLAMALSAAIAGCCSGPDSGDGAATRSPSTATSGAASASSTTRAAQADPATAEDREAVRKLIQRYYGTLASRDWDAARALLIGELADSFDPESAMGDVKLIGFEVGRLEAADGFGEAEVLERIRDAKGEPGVLHAVYGFEKAGLDWRISSIEYRD